MGAPTTLRHRAEIATEPGSLGFARLLVDLLRYRAVRAVHCPVGGLPGAVCRHEEDRDVGLDLIFRSDESERVGEPARTAEALRAGVQTVEGRSIDGPSCGGDRSVGARGGAAGWRSRDGGRGSRMKGSMARSSAGSVTGLLRNPVRRSGRAVLVQLTFLSDRSTFRPC